MYDKGETSTNPTGRVKNEKTGKWEEPRLRERTPEAIAAAQQRMDINGEDMRTAVARDEKGRATHYKREFNNGHWRTDLNAKPV